MTFFILRESGNIVAVTVTVAAVSLEDEATGARHN
jgi:hypothetical protein